MHMIVQASLGCSAPFPSNPHMSISIQRFKPAVSCLPARVFSATSCCCSTCRADAACDLKCQALGTQQAAQRARALFARSSVEGVIFFSSTNSLLCLMRSWCP